MYIVRAMGSTTIHDTLDAMWRAVAEARTKGGPVFAGTTAAMFEV